MDPGQVGLKSGSDPDSFRQAVVRALCETSMMFLVPPTLTQAEVDRTCEMVRRVMGVAG